MTNEKMTIHKALSELKVLDDRIVKAIHNGTYCLANKHSNAKVKGVAVSEFIKVIQGDYDKASDLIKRRNAIKRAVVLSNATTKVKVGNDEYTVAEAIEMKNHGMDFKQKLYETLFTHYQNAQGEILKQNGNNLDKRAEDYVIGLYGSREGKIDVSDYETTKKSFIESNTYELIDPIKVLDKINSLESEISAFKSEVDSALSTSNAITEIEINY